MTTRKSGLSPLLAAVYVRLTTHASTSSYSFYTDKRASMSLPYHYIKNYYGRESSEFTTRDTEAEENGFEIHSYFVSGRGPQPCMEAQDNIIQALTSAALSITGYHTPPIFDLDLQDVMRDDSEPTNLVFHGILRFRIHMAPSS